MSIVCLSDETLAQVVGGYTVIAEVGINSPEGSKFVTAPSAANTGILNAFRNVVDKGPGDLTNIDVHLAP